MILAIHGLVKDSHAPLDKLKNQLAVLEKERERADLRAQLLAYEMAEYQTRVATLLPQSLGSGGDAEKYGLRQLASVVSSGDSIQIERGSGLFERAKTAFRDKDFEGSNELLQGLIRKFPESTHVPAAYFLLSEGHYQRKEYAAAVSSIERMIESYPENELTGFALLRLGHIFEVQDRLEDAADVYKSILSNFKQPELARQARDSLKEVTL